MDQIQAGAVGRRAATMAVEQELRNRYRTAVMIRTAFLAAVTALGMVAFLLAMSSGRALHSADTIAIETMMFGLVSVVSALSAVFLVPLILPMRTRRSPQTPASRPAVSASQKATVTLYARAMISGSMSEVAGLLGFVLFVAGANVTVYAAFLATTLISSALTWPRWGEWEQAVADAEANPLL